MTSRPGFRPWKSSDSDTKHLGVIPGAPTLPPSTWRTGGLEDGGVRGTGVEAERVEPPVDVAALR